MKVIEPQLPGVPEVDILVPTHNRLDLTMRCILSIYFGTQRPFHLIVADASDDDLTEMYCRQLIEKGVAPLGQVKNMTYIRYEEPNWKEGNQFFNIAFRYCKSEYLTMVMNSVRVEPEWEITALDVMKQHPDVGIIGFKSLFGGAGAPEFGLIESAGIKMVKYLPTDIGRDLPGHRLTKIYECDAVQWAFAMVRKKAGMGNLQEGIFHGHRGWDDIDNCFSIKSKGWRILMCGDGVGYHEPRVSRGNNGEQAAKENRENGITFYKRWGLWDAYIKDHPDVQDIHALPKDLTREMVAV